jgi:excisionase family DNA binding protein
MQNETNFLNSTAACEYLGISRRTLSRIIQEGKIRYSKPRGSYRFHRRWLDSFLLGFQPTTLSPEQKKVLLDLEK